MYLLDPHHILHSLNRADKTMKSTKDFYKPLGKFWSISQTCVTLMSHVTEVIYDEMEAYSQCQVQHFRGLCSRESHTVCSMCESPIPSAPRSRQRNWFLQFLFFSSLLEFHTHTVHFGKQTIKKEPILFSPTLSLSLTSFPF